MRLINTTTLQFEQVPDSELHLKKNQYAILSHRWGRDEDEVTYQDILSSADVGSKKGFAKIQGFCKIASLENCQYGWVDTCCINKGDSSELTEAINSMYLWYKVSKVCVVYLEDVPQKPMTKSEWFDRGWTLQELIAPRIVNFFDQEWNRIGSKTELLAELSLKTRIPEDVLSHATKASACSVAQRMSWAATRITKRVEDRAYSLMGLFDVNMPMIYGEREKAFLRLQQNTIQKYKDESIFAWAIEHSDDTTKMHFGLYAPSPSAYLRCEKIVPTPGSLGFNEVNGELSLSTEIVQLTPGTYGAILNCTDRAYADNRVCIVVARLPEADSRVYVRVILPERVSRLSFQISKKRAEENIRVPIDPSEPPIPIYYGFWLRTLQPPGYADSQITVLSNVPTSDPDYICHGHANRRSDTGVVRIKPKNNSGPLNWSQICWMKFGFSDSFQPVVWLANDSQSARLGEPFERAVASRKSKVQSGEHKEVMEENLQKVCKGEKKYGLRYDWPEGKLAMEFHGTRLVDFVIDQLNLKISVQLLPINSPNTALSRNVDRVGLPEPPTMVWVVDITEAGRNIRSRSEQLGFENQKPGNWCMCISCYIEEKSSAEKRLIRNMQVMPTLEF